MLKVKHERDCDCVVAGFRWHKKGERTAVGSLLLGLFDDSGALQHVGVCASFTEKKRRELVEFLAPYRKDALAAHPWKDWAEHALASGEAEHRMPGGQSRWSQGKICLGSRYVPNWSSKSLTTTCRAAASVTPRSFAGGARTRSQATARMPSSRSFHHRSWR